MHKLKRYLTVKEFASKVKMTTQAIHKALKAKRNRIKKFVEIGSIYLIHESEVKKFKRMRESTR